MKVGVIADTHGFLDPRIPAAFAGVEHILHAGDIGPPALLTALERIAPVTAVLGNNDDGLPLQETECVPLGRQVILLHHIVEPGRLSADLRRQAEAAGARAVVFGHTHKPFAQELGDLLYFNPGYAGRQRFRLARSVALLHLDGEEIRHEFIGL